MQRRALTTLWATLLLGGCPQPASPDAAVTADDVGPLDVRPHVLDAAIDIGPAADTGAALDTNLPMDDAPDPVLSTFAFSSATWHLGSGFALTPSYVATDASGHSVTPHPVLSSSDASIVEVLADGRVMGRRIGTARLTAIAGSLAASTQVEVHQGYARMQTGFAYTCAIDASGAPFCWGCADNGETGVLPQGSGGRRVVMRPYPVEGAPRFREETFTVGYKHVCGVSLEDDRVYCWGHPENNALGTDVMGMWEVHRPMRADVTTHFDRLFAGHYTTCGIASDNHVECWGENIHGQLADGTTTSRNEARTLGDLRADAITFGYTHVCAHTPSNQVYCWGGNEFGQLGQGTVGADITHPVLVPGGPYRAVEGGANYTCVLSMDGIASCFGHDEQMKGCLGNGAEGDHASPTPVMTDQRFVALAAGFRHTCGLTAEGVAWCWGSGGLGLLADGGAEAWRALTPRRTVDVGERFDSISLFTKRTCVLTPSHVGMCWGENFSEALGTGTPLGMHTTIPTHVSDPDGMPPSGMDYPTCIVGPA